MGFELLYFDGCPSWQTAYHDLRQVLNGLGYEGSVRLVNVKTDEQAVDARFVGSPTIRLNEQDLFPVNHVDYALGCRVYVTPEGMRGYPTVDMLRNAISRLFSDQGG